MPFAEKEYKVGSNDGVISGVFKNTFFNDKFIIMGKIVLGDNIVFVFSIHFGCYRSPLKISYAS